MAGIVHFLRCVGRAAVKNGFRALANLVPFGGALYEIARDAHEEYRKDSTEEELRADLEGLAPTDAAEVRRTAEQVATEEAADQPDEVPLALASYLDQLPDSVRQTLFGPIDPGVVLPVAAPVIRPEDLLRLLPAAVPIREATVALRSPKRTYVLDDRLAAGDVANVHLAWVEGESADGAEPSCIVKVSRIAEGADVLDNEGRVLKRLLTPADDTTYRKYLPALVESFTADDLRRKRVNVFWYEPGFYTLEQVHARHPSLEGRHLAWIFKRLLTVLGFCHRQGTFHGAVLPCHVLLHAADHGLRLIGWGQAVTRGQRLTAISTRFRQWYPPEVFRKQPVSAGIDLFLAARCLIYLAGGDPVQNRMPDAVPGPMQRIIRSCLLEGDGMRPQDAWGLMDEFDGLLRRLYGPPKFVELNMS